MPEDCTSYYTRWTELYQKYADAYNDAADEMLSAAEASNDALESCTDVQENAYKIPVCISRTITAATRWRRAQAKSAKVKEWRDLADEQVDSLWECICKHDEQNAPEPPDADSPDEWDFEMDLTGDDDDDAGTPDGGTPIVPAPKLTSPPD